MSGKRKRTTSSRASFRPSHAESLRSAFQFFQDGHLPEAASLLQAVASAEPRNGEALHLLGLIALRQRDHERALAYMREAGAILTGSPLVANNLGVVLNEMGRNLEAAEAYRRAISLKPDYAEAHNNLGNALRAIGRPDEAVAAYTASLGVRPNDAATLNNLAGALFETHEAEKSVDIYHKAITADPGYFRAYHGLGNALREQGRPAEAAEAYRRAIGLKADYPEAHYSLGNALSDLGETSEAVIEYERAVTLRPDYAEAHNNLGNALRREGLVERAVDHYLLALSVKHDFAECRSNLGNALKDRGDIAGAIASYREALASNPDLMEAHSNLIYAKQFLLGTTLEDVLRDHREWNEKHVIPLRDRRFVHPSKHPSSVLRLGFVSGDFRRHPVGYFTVRVIEALSKLGCVVACYASQIENDEITQRFRGASHIWRDCLGLSDDVLSRRIYEDRIDILFDLTGHNERNRLMTFARKPAPVQITWAGYMATTGVETIDYIVADRCEIPEGSRRYYSERVIEMPHSFVCYDPPAYAPPVASPPQAVNGHVTFGCFNLLAKVSGDVVALWSEILRLVPNSRMVLKTKEFNSAEMRAYCMGLFVKNGIPPDRIDLYGGTSHVEHLAHYGKIDLALDPFPFSGSTTTLESLWMGVPVVTLPGETFASRHSLSFLSTLGLNEMAATGREHYVAIVEEMSADLHRFTETRSTLRERFQSSPLCDGVGFAEYLLRELRLIRP